MSLSKVGYSYAGMTVETAQAVRQRTEAIRRLVKQTAESIFEIGTHLLAVKESLPHGEFGRWLESEFSWTDRTARQFMSVAEAFAGKSETVSDLPARVLYLLAAPSTPEPARLEALERAEQGARISHKAAKEIVERHKGASPPSNSGKGRVGLLDLEPDVQRSCCEWTDHLHRFVMLADEAGVSVQAIANRAGRSEDEIRRVLHPEPPERTLEDFELLGELPAGVMQAYRHHVACLLTTWRWSTYEKAAHEANQCGWAESAAALKGLAKRERRESNRHKDAGLTSLVWADDKVAIQVITAATMDARAAMGIDLAAAQAA